jgi:hypothetical protein
MARIRTIKPEFWQDEKLTPMADVDRLLFLFLVSSADDCGRLLDKPSKIEADMFDGVQDRRDDVREALARLSRIGRILRGKTASGQRVIEITNWAKHQRVDHPNVKAAFPEIIELYEDTDIREAFANDSRGIREPLAHHTNDQRPVPATSTSESDQLSDRSLYSEAPNGQRDHDDAMRVALPVVHKSGHTALRELLRHVPMPGAWAGTIHGMASGLQAPNNAPVDGERLAVALCDFVAAGKHLDTPSLGLFRGFVKRARAPERGKFALQQTEDEYNADLLRTIREQNDRARMRGDAEKPIPTWANRIDATFPDGRTWPSGAAA